MDPTKMTYRADEAADLLGVGATTIYAMVSTEDIDTISLGTRRVLIPAREMCRLLGIDVNTLSMPRTGLTVSITKAAEILGVSRSTVYAAAKTGAIPTLDMAAHRRIIIPRLALLTLLGLPSDIDDLLRIQRREAEEKAWLQAEAQQMAKVRTAEIDAFHNERRKKMMAAQTRKQRQTGVVIRPRRTVVSRHVTDNAETGTATLTAHHETSPQHRVSPPSTLEPLEAPVKRMTLTVKETAALLGVSYGTIYSAAERGEIDAIAIGRRKVIPRREVERLLGEPLGDA